MNAYKFSTPCYDCLARQHGYASPAEWLTAWGRKGMTTVEIAERIGVGVVSLRNRLRYYGVTHFRWGGPRLYGKRREEYASRIQQVSK